MGDWQTLSRAGLIVAAALLLAQPSFADDRARLTIGAPAYVTHPDHRDNPEGWNEGWFQNEGLFADATWPVHRIDSHTSLRAGAAGGVFDNSIFRTSAFVAGAGEIETFATDHLSFSLGAYAGAITGYKNTFSPAATPYVGTSYAVSDELSIGARGFWLPAKTFGGSSIAESDAYVAAVTLSRRF